MANSTDSLSDGGTYHGIVQFQQWSDSSGGGSHQLGFTDNNNIWHRASSGALTTWSSWVKILNSSNYTSYVGNGTLTMNVSGVGLSGSQTFTANQSTATTFTVTSNATSANTASTIVARDASGNFTATNITATGGGSNGVNTGIISRDVTAARTTTTGVIYLGSDGNHYVYFDGTNYIMPSGGLTLNGSSVWTAGNLTNLNQLTNGPGYYSSGSSPTFAETYTNNWFRNNTSNTGLYNQSTTQHLSSNSNGYWDISSTTAAASGVIGIRLYTGGHVNTLRGYLYSDGSGIGLLNNQGGWSVLCNQGASYGGELRGSWTVTGTLTESSSVRYKENIADLSYSLEDALKLRPVEYTKIGTSHKEVGFIAEEVNDIIPEAVSKNDDGTVESISYGRLTAVLLQAVKEQQKQIEELKALLNK
jgi:hypothetical protein